MRISSMAVLFLASVCCANGADVVSKAPIEIISPMLPQEADANGDTLLIRVCRHAVTMPPEQRRHLMPIIGLLLESGANPLHENQSGCNAMFYINGMPELMQELSVHYRLPRELTLRLPYDTSALLRYLRLRTAQKRHAVTPGSQAYLLRRYCKPAYARAEALFLGLMKQESLRYIPEGALGDCLDFMRLTEPEKIYSYINELNYWEHGEHFLEEIPGLLLSELHRINWPVNPGKLRLALSKLNTMLPTSKDDMIDCYAAGPMIQLLDLLVAQEGERAMADVIKCTESHDPDLAENALRLQLKLSGKTPPDEPGADIKNLPEALQVIRTTLLADAALRFCEPDALTPEILQQAAACCRQHGMTERADFLNKLLEEKQVPLSAASMPIISTAYNELRESRPGVVLLRHLLTQPQVQEAATQP